uniref:Uncharacterized protein n=1 Tax=Cucumis melo TaxID=3656 RepID=A0A9I9EEP2_CUCME
MARCLCFSKTNCCFALWAVGCIFVELLTLKPLIQGQEVKGPLNPFKKDFEGGFSAENLGKVKHNRMMALFGSCVWSHSKTPPKGQNCITSRSPNNFHQEEMGSSSLKPQAFTLRLTEEDEEKLYKGYSFPPLSRSLLSSRTSCYENISRFKMRQA